VKGGEFVMKKLVLLVLLAALTTNLSACAQWGNAGHTKTKCPACGYEFDVPATK